MTYIWILDCSNACVTKVKLSPEREEELNKYLENNGDFENYIHLHEDDFGVYAESCVFMTSNDDKVFEVDF